MGNVPLFHDFLISLSPRYPIYLFRLRILHSLPTGRQANSATEQSPSLPILLFSIDIEAQIL
jgi:hypothetical protein